MRLKRKRATPPVQPVDGSAEKMVAVADAAASAARDAAPGYEVVVIVAAPTGPFRVSWGSIAADRAGWLVYRALQAIEKLL